MLYDTSSDKYQSYMSYYSRWEEKWNEKHKEKKKLPYIDRINYC